MNGELSNNLFKWNLPTNTQFVKALRAPDLLVVAAPDYLLPKDLSFQAVAAIPSGNLSQSYHHSPVS
jgi:hypothetical protein